MRIKGRRPEKRVKKNAQVHRCCIKFIKQKKSKGKIKMILKVNE